MLYLLLRFFVEKLREVEGPYFWNFCFSGNHIFVKFKIQESILCKPERSTTAIPCMTKKCNCNDIYGRGRLGAKLSMYKIQMEERRGARSRSISVCLRS
uniref:Uncharacterized protein n=1 Tax=Rhipicephalus zambeziensis TaxID=60191 RepID=A0A224YFZ8_9ACAR